VCEVVNDSRWAIWQYNWSVPDSQAVRPGDYIVAVGDACNDSLAMASALTDKEQPSFVIQRPALFEFRITKDVARSCLQLKYAPGGTSLLVKEVNGSARLHLQQGDRILRVNRIKGQAESLLAAMREDDVLNLQVSRAL